MGLNPCPIEPDDWSWGPEDDPDACPECNGVGTINADSPVAFDLEETCPRCGGSGFVDPPDMTDDN